MTLRNSTQKVDGVLLDIEGTTTPISFVYEVLFPFARIHARDYLEKHFGDVEVQQDIQALLIEHADDESRQLSPPPIVKDAPNEAIASVVGYLKWLMDQDRKSTGLKSIQGKIWEEGYRSGHLRSQIFSDVPPAMRRWHDNGLTIAIFSSGSVLAQKLLFGNTGEGDLTGLVDNYFDTTVGSKLTSESYRRITDCLELAAPNLLFISDVVKELDAARDAGLGTLLCVRPGNHPQPPAHEHSIVGTFGEIDFI